MSKLANFTVGIKSRNGQLVGTGFVVAEGVIVTCAHVLRDLFARNAQIGEQVTVRFSALDEERVTRVEAYDRKHDVATLKSLNPLPKEVKSAILCNPDDITKPIEFVTLGYRRLGKSREGIPARGRLVERVSKTVRPQLILESKQIAPGMSGAPLYIPSVNRVVGMITSYWDAERGGTKRDEDTAFALPNDAIQKVWPTLEYQTPELIADSDLKKSLQVLFKVVREQLMVELRHEQKNEAWQQVVWEEAASKYAQKMAYLYGTMRVLGKSEPVSLEGIYTDVHVLETPTSRRRYSQKQSEKYFARQAQSYQNKERQDGFEVVQKKDKLFVLGKPGAGKTTFLKYIALQAMKGRIQKVPIFVSLKALADSEQKVLPFIVEQFEICDFPHAGAFVKQLLKKGQALVLFDGLDEVPQEERKRANLIQELNNFTHHYDASHYIITCRIAATEYRFDLFTYVEMADFTPAQVEAFVRQWFRQDEPKRQGFLQGLQKKTHRGLREMTRHPLLLTMLCLTFEETLTFPARRVEIYQEALDTLLKKWDSSRNIQRDKIYRTLSLGRKRQLFARIAAETFEQGTYFIRQAELAKKIEAYLRHVPQHNPAEVIDGLAILKAIEAQHGIFSEQARGIYSFAHLTFQEYFAAKYIVENEARGTVTSLITSHLNDNRWQEVFLMTATLLDNANRFFEQFLKQLNQPIISDNDLLTLLIWADKKATEASSRQNDTALRSAYIYIMFFFHFAQNPNKAKALGEGLDLALDRILVLEQVQGLGRALALERSISLGQALGEDRPLKQKRKLAIALARDRTLNLDLVRDQDFYTNDNGRLNFNLDTFLVFSWLVAAILSKTGLGIEGDLKAKWVDQLAKIIERAIQMSQKLSSISLHQALKQIELPDSKASKKEWFAFYHTVGRIVSAYRKFEIDQPLSTEQYQRLATYLVGTKFLLECLELAYVSDREAIHAQLLFPSVPVEEELPPAFVEIKPPAQEPLPPVKENWVGKWWVGLFVGLLLGGWLVWWLMLG